jgi:DNA repair exonuclease SbcCD ATPase subunit
MYNTLKVDKIAIKNMRKIGYISINEIDKNFNVISGKNGAGKTTVLDALFFAIIGRTYFDRGISIESIIKK